MAVPKLFVMVDWDHDSEMGVESQDDITEDVKQIEVEFGKNRELDKVQATALTLTVDNVDNKYSPSNPNSVLNTGGRTLKPGHWIEVIAAYPYDSFAGANGTALSAHTPDNDSGFAWSIRAGAPVLDGTGKAKPSATGACMASL